MARRTGLAVYQQVDHALPGNSFFEYSKRILL